MHLQPDAGSMEDIVRLTRRDDSTSTTSSNSQTWTWIVVAVIFVVVVSLGLIISYLYLRKWKINGRSPKYIPTQFLKKKWESWKPQGKYANVERTGSASEQAITVTFTTNQETEEVRDTSNVNRNTSVRSVMTLPAYSYQPKDNEEVIGREGERAGIDTVVELPETAEEEEDRRETEMESLFQIRQARRREIAERDERRRERREARERNDWTRLEELRREARARRDQNSITNLTEGSASNVNLTAEMLIAEHNARGRERKVSEVSYARVGQVRHDGSRIRSNSHDSERSGLLGGAAPMGMHTRNGSESTLLSLGGPPQPRYRDRSDSAATANSMTTFNTDQVGSSSDLSRLTTTRTGASSHLANVQLSEAESEEGDIGTERLAASEAESDFEDAPQPPDYDGHEWGDAPDYMSRANSVATTHMQNGGVRRIPSRAPRLEILSLNTPSIHIDIPSSPQTPASPATVRAERTPLSGGVTPRP